MPTLTEGMHTGEFILELTGAHASLENVIVASGENLQAGTVVGATTAVAPAIAGSGNVGNGTVAITVVGSGARVGSYGVVFTAATTFTVTGPDGAALGSGTTGVAFTGGGVTFTITAGATPFVAGDTFVLPVSRGQVKAWVPGASDGTQTVSGVVIPAVNATAGPKRAAAVVRMAEVNGRHLMWASGTTAAQMETGKLALRGLGIIVS